jgi:hypothetical protein
MESLVLLFYECYSRLWIFFFIAQRRRYLKNRVSHPFTVGLPGLVRVVPTCTAFGARVVGVSRLDLILAVGLFAPVCVFGSISVCFCVHVCVSVCLCISAPHSPHY